MKESSRKQMNLEELYPEGRSSFLADWKSIFGRLSEYRFFLKQLIKIDLHTEYKRSFIGLSWLLILPILAVLIWILLNSAGIVSPGDTGIPYPAYVLLSTSIWGFFSEIYRTTSRTLIENGKMMVITNFPIEVLVLQKVIVHLIRFSIPFLLNIIVLLYFGVSFSIAALLFPLSLIPLLLLGLSLGLVIAPLRVVAVDFSHLFDEFIRLLMFLTPIVYAPKIDISWLQSITHWNPLTYLIGFSRELLTEGKLFEAQIYVVCAIACFLFFLLSLRLFRSVQSRILERLITQ